MSKLTKTKTIKINQDEKVIKFSRSVKKAECGHLNIEISEDDSELLCLDCNTKLNPIAWIANHLEEVNSMGLRNSRILAEARIIEDKLEGRGDFECSHCKKMNSVDWTSLPERAAVIRGMKLIDSEFDGHRVEKGS